VDEEREEAMTQTHEEWCRILKVGDRVEVIAPADVYGERYAHGWVVVTVDLVEGHGAVSSARNGVVYWYPPHRIRPIQSEPAKVEALGNLEDVHPGAAEAMRTLAEDVVRLRAEVASLRAELASLRPQPVESDRGRGLLTVNDSMTKRWGR
jgi:hypothetical protein